MRRQRFVKDHEREYPVTKLCEAMGISRSGFYQWRNAEPSARKAADAALVVTITDIHERSLSTYGSPRVHGELQRCGVHVGRKRVARLMHQERLVGAHGRRKWRRGKQNRVHAPDLLKRDFRRSTPNEAWVADISEFTTGEGKFYLAGVKDLASNALVGWSMANRQTTDLIINAVVMAVERREPKTAPVHHSDRGTQYTSLAFTQRLNDLGLVQSFGSTGDCYDNAAMESFWATLKRELAHIHGTHEWATRNELRRAIFSYIEVFYNRTRSQARLGYLSPATFEDKLLSA